MSLEEESQERKRDTNTNQDECTDEIIIDLNMEPLKRENWWRLPILNALQIEKIENVEHRK